VLLIINYFAYLLAISPFQEIPFTPKENFELKLDYQFKQRPQADNNSVNLAETKREYDRRTATGVLPYLILNIKVLTLPEEITRVRVSKNMSDRPVNRKVTANSLIQLDLGFTDDMKDRVTAYEYHVYFLSAKKEIRSQILITVDKDGSFFVNGERRGKF
jgi:hypothetical protein